MSDLDLDQLAALDQAATLGPWEAQEGAFGDPANGPDHMRVLREGWCTAYDVEHTVARLEGSQVGAADAALIAAARNALPALIDAARDRDRWHALYCQRDDLLLSVEAERDAARAEVAALRERVEAHAYGVEVLVNAGTSSAYWRLDDDEQVRDTYDEAAEQWDALVDCGYDPEHLRIVALSVVNRTALTTGGDRG